tara:strand:- start:18966 stop:20468 length:1503 start_codon:yes stop_codon:yes gene_type:complete
MNNVRLILDSYLLNKKIKAINILIFSFLLNLTIIYLSYWYNDYKHFSIFNGDWLDHWESIFFDGVNFIGCNFICAPYPFGYFFKFIELKYNLGLEIAILIFSLILFISIYFTQELIRYFTTKFSFIILIFIFLSPSGFLITLTYYKDIFMYASLILVFNTFIYFLIDKKYNPLKKIFFIFLFIFAILIMNLSRHPGINLIFLINIIFFIIFFIKYFFLEGYRFNKNIIYVVIISVITSFYTLNYHFEIWLVNETGLGVVNKYKAIPQFGLKYFKEIDSTIVFIDKIKKSSSHEDATNLKKTISLNEIIAKILHRKIINSSEYIIIERDDDSKNIVKDIYDNQSNKKENRINEANTIVTDLIKKADDYKVQQEKYGIQSKCFYDGDKLLVDFYHSIIQPSPLYVIKCISYNNIIKTIFASEIFFTNLFLLGLIFVFKNKYPFENLFIILSSCLALYIIFTFEVNYGTYLRHKFFFWKIISAIGLINILIYLSNLKYKIFIK